MFQRPQVLIALGPSSLDAAVGGPSGYRMERFPLDPIDWEKAWSQGLVPLDGPLQETLERLGVRRRARATIIHHGPDVHADVFSLPGTPRDAERAARLALGEAFPGGLRGNPAATRVLARDGVGPAARCHVLGLADRDESAQALCDWAGRAGCCVREVIPARSLLLAEAVARASRLRAAAGGAIILLGEHATVIAGVSEGCLRVARLISFGHDLLTDAVRRAARTVASDHGAAGRAAIAEELYRSGLPARHATFPGVEGLTGSAIMPLSQPVVQRLAVEIKQTLRFALNSGDVSRMKLMLGGTGAAIPGLGAQLSEILDAQVDIETGSPGAAGLRPGSDLDLLGRHGRLGLSLLPQAESRDAESSRAGLGVRVGAVSVALLLAGLGVQNYRLEQQIAERAVRLAPLTAETRARAAMRAQADIEDLKLRGEMELVDRAMSPAIDCAALLNEVSRLTPSAVRLTDLHGGLTGAAPAITVQGFAVQRSGSFGADSLGAYVDALAKSPLIAGVELGTTRTGESDAGPVKHFSLTIRPQALAGRELASRADFTGGTP